MCVSYVVTHNINFCDSWQIQHPSPTQGVANSGCGRHTPNLMTKPHEQYIIKKEKIVRENKLIGANGTVIFETDR